MVKIVLVADCVVAGIEVVAWSVFAGGTLGAADAETHGVPGGNSDGVAGAARLGEHEAGRLSKASDVSSLLQVFNEDEGMQTTMRKAWTILQCG